MKKIIEVMLSFVFALLSSSHTWAQANNGNGQAQALGNHHQELTFSAISGEMLYIPIPKQNFPVNVQISVPKYFTGQFSPFMVTFSVVDTQGNVLMTRPNFVLLNTATSPYPQLMDDSTLTRCFDPLSYDPNQGQLYGIGGCMDSHDQFVFGVAGAVAGLLNRLIVGIPIATLKEDGTPYFNDPVPVYVSMWY